MNEQNGLFEKEGCNSDMGDIKYSNGVYSGAIENGKRKGIGTMYYSNGDMYKGEWVNDRKQGQGTMKFANGNVYEGGWVDDQFEGKGKLTICKITLPQIDIEDLLSDI